MRNARPDPRKRTEAMQRNNPMTYAKDFKTPMLLIAGELDYRVPYGNSLPLCGVLQAMGVPSRLLMYPNENHWILSTQPVFPSGEEKSPA